MLQGRTGTGPRGLAACQTLKPATGAELPPCVVQAGLRVGHSPASVSSELYVTPPGRLGAGVCCLASCQTPKPATVARFPS